MFYFLPWDASEPRWKRTVARLLEAAFYLSVTVTMAVLLLPGLEVPEPWVTALYGGVGVSFLLVPLWWFVSQIKIENVDDTKP